MKRIPTVGYEVGAVRSAVSKLSFKRSAGEGRSIPRARERAKKTGLAEDMSKVRIDVELAHL
jgi:hypothetical protein